MYKIYICMKIYMYELFKSYLLNCNKSQEIFQASKNMNGST